MKTAQFLRCLISLAVGILLAGCEKGSNNTPPPPPPPPPAPTTTAAPQDASPPANQNGYLGALAAAQRLAVKTVDVSSLNQQIQLFNEQEGRYPTDLKELVSKHYIGQLPAAPTGMKLVYDAKEGKVTVAKAE